MLEITFDKSTKTFHLKNDTISYIMGVKEDLVLHYYYGKKINHYKQGRSYPLNSRSGFSPVLPSTNDEKIYLDAVLQEYSNDNHGDYRIPAIIIHNKDGSYFSDFRYRSYQIMNGKPSIDGLPSTYETVENKCKTLILYLTDAKSKMEMALHYSIFEANAAIIRSVKVVNNSNDTINLKKIMSINMDFPSEKTDLLYLAGSWARERNVVREEVKPGLRVLDSNRGASSHAMNPAIAIGTKGFGENHGQIYGLSLVYSGSFEINIEKDPFGQCRIQAGISSHDFSWKLDPGKFFATPEAILSFSDKGLNPLSQNIHDLCNNQLIRGKYKKQVRPILLNNWEATYMEFTEEKLLQLAQKAAKLGIELFVVDDGWFGRRNDDHSSLGDWYENTKKIPQGLHNFSQKIHALGLKFGLWFEPEMISKNSELYLKHPDWLMTIPDIDASPARNQYILDFCKEEVLENIFSQMCQILDNVKVDYIKWDMNRNFSEIYSTQLESAQQGKVSHLYILNVYKLMDKLTTRYPDLLFEGCSGGGGRFDLGMLYYMPQIWTSDNTDALSRIKIQYGTSFFYPISSIGAHVSAVPNHQTMRTTSLFLRGNVAMSGVFGYELDINSLVPTDLDQMKEQIDFYKKYRSLFLFGSFYRLLSPFEEEDVSWMFVDKNKEEVLVFYAETFRQPHSDLRLLKLLGLDPQQLYCDDFGQHFFGDELMYSGLYIDNVPRFNKNTTHPTFIYHLKGSKNT